ncbi:hypothetical protein G6F61_009185 [Rhizopus arrhizus]|nr:hypothetical protein G6F38_004561 [Rhizopus arrhizus]KAG1163467.1 hypothetical protein G6F37_001171 [Rhizopus arrhizus]KAG1374603.1 hypothetical protein G6F61_009185 [Rhizopus arrhizus]
MSDEEDYMSLKFLEEAKSFENENKKESYSERRKRQLREQQQKAYIKPRHILEQEERERGLQTSVDNDNKGMKMLMKMGFKKGNALGKKGTEGIMEPIKVDLKTGRQGIGMESELRKREREEEEEMERKKVKIDPDDFRAIMAQRAKESQHMRYLVAAVSICQKLDEESGVESNILWLLKPEEEKEDKEEGEEEEDKEEEDKEVEEETKQEIYPEEEVENLKSLPLDEKVEKLINYLREKYYYCFWCRAKYEDQKDLDENCPGTDEEDH